MKSTAGAGSTYSQRLFCKPLAAYPVAVVHACALRVAHPAVSRGRGSRALGRPGAEVPPQAAGGGRLPQRAPGWSGQARPPRACTPGLRAHRNGGRGGRPPLLTPAGAPRAGPAGTWRGGPDERAGVGGRPRTNLGVQVCAGGRECMGLRRTRLDGPPS